jgi:hypothetical protein
MECFLHYLTKIKSEVMKTVRIKVVCLFWILGFLGISLIGNSQDIKLSRQEKKEVRKVRMAVNFSILDSLLNSKSFVLEADFLQNKYGERVPVVSNLNFIKVDKSNGILQTGATSGLGYNGVGGVTAQGTISDFKVFKDSKKLTYRVRFNLMSNIGTYGIFMNVSADNHATAMITGIGPGSLTWDGHLTTIYNSRVFKGQDTY